MIAVVTDSTAYLPPALVASAGISVVPLSVVLGGASGTEGVDVGPAEVARTLAARRTVSTSRPSPSRFASCYRELLSGGATGVVSVHLAAGLSGTYGSARIAAENLDGDRIAVVDSGSTAMGLGFAVLAGATAAAAGADLAGVRAAVLAAAARTTTLFCVDSLEHLRRGGRITAAAALVGGALAVKPILSIAAGEIVLREKVRTATRALSRLADLGAEAAGTAHVDAAVHHLTAPDRAAALVTHLRTRVPHLHALHTIELGPAVAAHVGPNTVGLVIHRHP
jgi:DegV family protein with EDD domain